MKIGIITFSNANNIGAMLQAYALQQFIKNCEYDTIHINFKYSFSSSAGKKTNKLVSKVNSLIHIKSTLRRRLKDKKFSLFRQQFLEFGKDSYFNTIKENAEDCDAYITGSDQVWNSDLNGANSAFYLNFVNGRKKIAYAASVGRSLTDNDKKAILENCNDFDSLSVRENDLNEFLIANKINSQVVVDPVFLLNKQKWKDIESKVKTPEKYVFCYVMEQSDTLCYVAQQLAKKHFAKIIWLNGGGIKPNNFPGKEIKVADPREFIYLIDNSVCVVTNSFHGAAFSIILDKSLYIIKHSKRNSRLEQLASLVGTENNIIDNKVLPDNIENKKINQESDKLNDVICQSKEFIISSLEYDYI